MKPNDSPQFELSDEIAKIRLDLGDLRNTTNLILKELSLCREAIAKLHREVSGRPSPKETRVSPIEQLCKTYLDVVSNMKIIHKVFCITAGNTATFWTIVDTPPPEDSPSIPQYNEQLNTLLILKENMPVDFYILDVSELSEEKQQEEPIPTEAELI